MPRPPAAVTRAAVSSIVSGRPAVAACPVVLRPEQYTVAPASPSMREMPRPAPRVAPATTATFPVSGLVMILRPVYRPAATYESSQQRSSQHHHRNGEVNHE